MKTLILFLKTMIQNFVIKMFTFMHYLKITLKNGSIRLAKYYGPCIVSLCKNLKHPYYCVKNDNVVIMFLQCTNMIGSQTDK